MLRKLIRSFLVALLVFVFPFFIFAGSVLLLAQDAPTTPAGVPDGFTIIEEDIAVPDSFFASGNSPAATFTIDPWLNGIVPYAFSSAVTTTNRNYALSAMAEWEAVAGVDFIPRTTEANYIYFINDTGNWSYVGQIGGEQEIGIYNWSSRFVIAHELAHALGWWHEQSRPDRGSYIQINSANITSGYASNFNMQSAARTFGAYDFESVMHYGQYSFSSNGQPTITVLPPYQSWQSQIGQRNRLSSLDKQGMAYLYPAALHNGDFSGGLSQWYTYALPAANAVTANVTGGVLEFRRNAGGDQAVVLQTMNGVVDTTDTLEVTIQLGNSSPYRKRLSLLLHNQDWTDNQVCVFWLPANATMRTYTMRVRPTQTWVDPVISLYSSSTDTSGYLRVDNVRVTNAPTLQSWTYCIDPLAPNPTAGADSGNLLTNAGFSSGLNSWTLYGQIASQLNAGVFDSYRMPGTPTGVLAQQTLTAAAANTPLELSFQLGNSSSERLRATFLLHDADWSDSQACTFWVAPHTPLSTYVIRTHTTKAWSNITFSYYPSTVPTTGNAFLQLDNISLRKRPGTDVNGTHCYIPGTTPADAAVYVENFDSAQAAVPPSAPIAQPEGLPPGELPLVATPIPFEMQAGSQGEGLYTEGG